VQVVLAIELNNELMLSDSQERGSNEEFLPAVRSGLSPVHQVWFLVAHMLRDGLFPFGGDHLFHVLVHVLLVFHLLTLVQVIVLILRRLDHFICLHLFKNDFLVKLALERLGKLNNLGHLLWLPICKVAVDNRAVLLTCFHLSFNRIFKFLRANFSQLSEYGSLLLLSHRDCLLGDEVFVPKDQRVHLLVTDPALTCFVSDHSPLSTARHLWPVTQKPGQNHPRVPTNVLCKGIHTRFDSLSLHDLLYLDTFTGDGLLTFKLHLGRQLLLQKSF